MCLTLHYPGGIVVAGRMSSEFVHGLDRDTIEVLLHKKPLESIMRDIGRRAAHFVLRYATMLLCDYFSSNVKGRVHRNV